jgi:hypothetical protein
MKKIVYAWPILISFTFKRVSNINSQFEIFSLTCNVMFGLVNRLVTSSLYILPMTSLESHENESDRFFTALSSYYLKWDKNNNEFLITYQ